MEVVESSERENLQDVCVCNVCVNVYDEENHTPKILPCSHTICLSCIRTLMVGDSLSCPEYRTNQTISKVPGRLPTNRKVYEMLNELTDNTNLIPVSKVCDRCLRPEWKRKATTLCCNCRHYLCNLCTRDHKVSKFTKDHKVKNVFQDPNASSDYYCDEHKSVLCKVCLSCNLESICIKCEKHENHDVVTFDDFDVESLIDKMRHQFAIIQEFQTSALISNKKQWSSNEAYFKSIDAAKEAVSSCSQERQKKLQEREKYMLQQLDNMKVIAGKELKNSTEKCENMIESIKQIISSNDGCHLVEMIRAVKEYELFILEIKKKTISTTEPVINFVKFVPGNTHEFENCLQNFGSFQKETVSIEDTKVVIKTGLLNMRSQCLVNLRRTDQSTATNINTVSVINAQVLHKQSVLEDTEIVSLGQGRFDISYIPRTLSNHQLKVWAFEKPVSSGEVIPIVDLYIKDLKHFTHVNSEFIVTVVQRCIEINPGDDREGRFNPWPQYEVICRHQDKSKLETKKIESFVDREMFRCIPTKVGVVSVNVHHTNEPLPFCQREILVSKTIVKMEENIEDFIVLPTEGFAVIHKSGCHGQFNLIKYDNSGCIVNETKIIQQDKGIAKTLLACDSHSKLFVLSYDKNSKFSIDEYDAHLNFDETSPYKLHVDEYADLHCCDIKRNSKGEMILSDPDAACFWVLDDQGTLTKRINPISKHQQDNHVSNFCIDREDHIVFCDMKQGNVKCIGEDGNIIWTTDSFVPLEAPSLVSINDIYFAVFDQNRILLIETETLNVKLIIPCKYEDVFQMFLCENEFIIISDRKTNCVVWVS